MSNEFFSSRKMLMSGVLAAVLGTASLVVIAKDSTSADPADNQQRSCENGRGQDADRGDRMGRDGDRMGRHDRGFRQDDGLAMKGMPGMGRGGMDMTAMGERELRNLDLSAEQQGRITAIQDEARSKNWSLMGESMKVHNRIRDLYAAATFDEKALKQAYTDLAALQQQMFMSGTEARLHVMSVLTDEQRQQLKSDDRAPRG